MPLKPKGTPVLRMAVAIPLFRFFDYLLPAGFSSHSKLRPGVRFRVPFGHMTRVAVLIKVVEGSDFGNDRLKTVLEMIDSEPVLSADMMRLLSWAGDYYHHPGGDVVMTALPALLRQGKPARATVRWRVMLSAEGKTHNEEDLAHAPRQRQIFAYLRCQDRGIDEGELSSKYPACRPFLKALVRRGWVERYAATEQSRPEFRPGPALNEGQARAVARIQQGLGAFQAFLLYGVTGSGKTEVYFKIIEQVIRAGQQALFLVPEIGLTPQLLARFAARFEGGLSLMHSAMTDRQRLDAWCQARDGEASIVLGTRSAVFAPLPRLGVIILDEEHDPSYKQQQGFLYHARDFAVMRAKTLGIPVILGSATPSMETLHNVSSGRYLELSLPVRASGAALPAIRVLDMRSQAIEHGLTRTLLQAIGRHLNAGHQALVFLNRRGFATHMVCHQCGWIAGCRHCDTRLVLHHQQGRLRCHYCGFQMPVVDACPECQGRDLRSLGYGTERLESVLSCSFPGIELIRVDRDSTQAQGGMDAVLGGIRDDRPQILLGTQLLAKGHDFPNVTLAAIVNADQGLYGSDFRSSERMGQLILQVAGRAGRASHLGEVILQSYHPEHPLLLKLQSHDYRVFAKALIQERQDTQLPPYSSHVLLRADAKVPEKACLFLECVSACAVAKRVPQVEVLGPVTAVMERRVGRYHAHLLFQCRQRRPLHHLMDLLMPELERCAAKNRVHWVIDVDPIEMM